MKYLLDIETYLQMSDMIVSKYRPLNILEGCRFLPTLRYPILGRTGTVTEQREVEKYVARNKLQDSLSPTPYLAVISCDMMKELLLNMIYINYDYEVRNSLKFNSLLNKSSCIFRPDNDYHLIIREYINIITNEDFDRLERLIKHIYITQLLPIVECKNKNIWDIELETNNVWLVDIGNVYEYRFKEAIENTK